MQLPLSTRRLGLRSKLLLGLLSGTLPSALASFGAQPEPVAAPVSAPATVPAPAAQPQPASAADLLRTDAEFDALGASAGLAEAFARYAAPQGFLAASGGLGPEDARTVFSKIVQDPNYRLRWTPLFAQLAKAGDLGYTVGSFVREFSDRQGRAKKAQGLYLTVWRRQEDGHWRFVADAGSGLLDEKTVAKVVNSFREHPALPPTSPASPVDPEALRKETSGLDELFSRYSELNGEHAALRHFLSDDALLFTLGVRTRPALLEALARDGGRPLARWEQLHSEVSASGELLCSWGLWRRIYPGSAPARSGTYVSVWQRQKSGEWRLVLKAESKLDESACATLRQRLATASREVSPPSPPASNASTSASEGGLTQPGAVVQTSAATEQAKRSESKSEAARIIP